jgi:hypothetical protein
MNIDIIASLNYMTAGWASIFFLKPVLDAFLMKLVNAREYFKHFIFLVVLAANLA